MLETSRRLMAAAGATAMLTLAPVAAQAQDLSSTITCLRGAVSAGDYAELTQRLRESIWDRRGGVTLVSSIYGLKLRVIDSAMNSVCEDTADRTTSCTFRVNLQLVDEFTIYVDNMENADDATYKLCAF